jgi:hypothetical protein
MALWKEEWDMRALFWIGLQMPGADMTQASSWNGIFTDILCNEERVRTLGAGGGLWHWDCANHS